MILRGIINQMMVDAGRILSKKLILILLAVGFGGAQLQAVTNNGVKFETPPPKPGSIQWDLIHRNAKERQELYRKRFVIPAASGTNAVRISGGNFAYSQRVVAAPAPPRIPGSGLFWKILFFTAVFTFTGLLIARRFASNVLDDLNQRFNPWPSAPAAERILPETVRAEEESFARFLTSFRVGPSVPASVESPVNTDPLGEFFVRAASLLGVQRTLLEDIRRAPSSLIRQKALVELRSGISLLKGEAVFPEVLPVWQVTTALEGLLKELIGKAGNVTPSALRAVTGGVDLLDNLCVPGLKPDLLSNHPLTFLVVDDDLISRQAMSLALKKAFGQPDTAVDAETALIQVSQHTYDVIFLDVQMPGMDGFELCTKIRETDLNRGTPVVFVTGQSDFDAHAKATLSGGTDLMGKPFLIFEITVKAITLALQGRLQGQVQKPLPKPAPGRDKADPLVTVTDVPNLVSSPAIVTLPPLPASMVTATDNFTGAFLTRAATHLGPLRDLCQTILQSTDEEARQNLLADAFLRINSLISTNNSGVVHPAYQISVALEGLFKKMLSDAKHSTPSALATVVTAVDLLNDLCVPGMKADLATNPPVNILVVDDDLVTRRVIVGALQTVFTRPESVENGEDALALAMEKPFDVIFMDVIMPGMDGFETCSKIRNTVPNCATPVIFVTGHGDFQARARMVSNGGNELMGKPFLTAEINVKALTFALRGRLERLKTEPHL